MDTLPKRQPVIESLNQLRTRRAARLAGSVLSLTGLAAGASACASQEVGGAFENVEPSNVRSLVVMEGANVREQPHTTSSYEGTGNILLQTNQTYEVTIDPDEEAFKHVDENGEWFGIPAYKLGLEDKDDDGRVWINEERIDEVIEDNPEKNQRN